MKSKLWTIALVLLTATLMGCASGDDGDTGKISVSMSSSNVSFASDYLGCLVISSSKTACICNSSGVNQVDGDTLTGLCDTGDSSITLIPSGSYTTYTDVDAGDHYYCFTSSTSTTCGNGTTGYLAFTANAGTSASSGFPSGKDGDAGADKTYTVLFSTDAVPGVTEQ